MAEIFFRNPQEGARARVSLFPFAVGFSTTIGGRREAADELGSQDTSPEPDVSPETQLPPGP